MKNVSIHKLVLVPSPYPLRITVKWNNDNDPERCLLTIDVQHLLTVGGFLSCFMKPTAITDADMTPIIIMI